MEYEWSLNLLFLAEHSENRILRRNMNALHTTVPCGQVFGLKKYVPLSSK
jgi:hypothetical protein